MTALVLTCALGACKSKQKTETTQEGSGSAAAAASPACVPAKSWTPISTDKAPPIQPFTTVKLDGDKWLVFGHTGLVPHTVAGAVFDACTNTWAPASGDGMPLAISRPAFVTGSERRDVPSTRRLEPIAAGAHAVWLYPGMPMTVGDPARGKQDDDSPLASTIAAAIYDVANQTWREIPLAGPLANVRVAPSVVWTGKELLVWGGAHVVQDGPRTNSAVIADGAAIDPATGTVRPLATDGAPPARANAATVWTGTHMFVWGGCVRVTDARTLQGCEPVAGGALYDPVANTWKPVSAKNAPRARISNAAAMAAGKVVVFRGTERDDDRAAEPSVRFDNAFYDVATDTWTQIPPKDVAGESVIGDYLFAVTQKFDGTDIARLYKIGGRDDWRDVELVPGNETMLLRPDLAISRRPLTGGDSMVPHAPTGVLRFDPRAGTWRSSPLPELPYPLFTDAGLPDTPHGYSLAGDRFIAWRVVGTDAPPAPCAKKKCESWETAQVNLALQGWFIEI